MALGPLTPRSVFRYFKVDGVPSSGKHEPIKAEIIQLLETLFGTSRGGWVITRTLEELNGVAPEGETDGGVVLADPDPANNGYYERAGSEWVKGRGFPDTFARVELSGDSTAQVGEVRAGVNPADIEVYFAFVTTENASPLTLAIGGEAPREVVSLAGSPLLAGEWTGAVMFALRDGKYQLLLDAGAAQAAAHEADRASDEADRAEAAAAIAQQGDGKGLAEFETRALAEAWPGVDPMPDSIVIRGDASVDDGLGGTFALEHPSSDTIVVAGESYGRAAIPISALPQSLTSDQKQQARENIGVTSVPPFSLREDAIETRLADCFVLNSGVPSTSQGIAVDEVNGWLYLLQETQSQGFISRFELNGRRAQVPESVQNPSPLIAHEGMAIDASGKLWVAARGQNPNVYRGQYVPEGSFAPDDASGETLFKFFTDKPNAGGYGAPSVSPDGQLLLVRCAIGEVYYVRGFRLADVSDPGDYTGQELFTFCWTGDFPVQAFSVANDEILVTGGFGTPSAPMFDIRRFDFEGEELEPPAILDETEMPWAASDGAGISTISEPEGVCWVSKPEGMKPMLLVSNGQPGDRIHRVFGMGFNAKQDAGRYSDDIIASFSTPPSPAHEAAIRDAVFALVSGGIWDRMGALWVFAARAQDQRLVNWIDPRRGALTVHNESGLSVQDKVGITGLGGGTGAWLFSDYSVDKTPNHYRDACHACVAVLSTGDTRGAVLEAEAGGWTRLYPRDLNNNAKTRLMDSAPESTFSGITDASGVWVITRQRRSEYELWRNASLVGIATQPSERLFSVEKRHKLLATATTAQIAWASVGYHLTEKNQTTLKSLMENFLLSMAAL